MTLWRTNLKPEAREWILFFTFWLVALITFQSVLTPFLAGFFGAYSSYPFTRFLRNLGWKNTSSALLTTVLFYGVIFLTTLFLLPFIKDFFLFLVSHLPFYQQKLKIILTDTLSRLPKKILQDHMALLGENLNRSVELLLQGLSHVLIRFWDQGLKIGTYFSVFIFSPVISFHALKDWEALRKQFIKFSPRRIQPHLPKLMTKMDLALRGYGRGQLLVCLSSALFYGIFLGLTQFRYFFLIGFLTGLFAFIPYIAFGCGVGITLLLCLFHGASMGQTLYVIGVFTTGQILESILSVPYFVGSRTGLHPLWVLFSIFVGAHFKGIMGIILAVPCAALLKATLMFFYDLYWRKSTLSNP